MPRQKITFWLYVLGAFCLSPLPLSAQQHTSAKPDASEPIEVVSDTLEVFQPEQRAIFTGNVIATQGNVNMRAEKMTVFYHTKESKNTEADTGEHGAKEAAIGEGIYKIEAEKNVFFSSPTETAQGDAGIYEVDKDIITLYGNVFLTRAGNVLQGTKMIYNLGTGRSVLVGESAKNGQKSGRVRGLFVPKKDEK